MNDEASSSANPENQSPLTTSFASRSFNQIIYGVIMFLFYFRLICWILTSLYYPAATDLALHGFRIDHVIRTGFPMERPWFISAGFIGIVRFLRLLPFEYRAPAVHLFDDSLLIGFFVIAAFWCYRNFSTAWPAVAGVTFLISRSFESLYVVLSDRDWYAAMFSFASVLAAGASSSRRNTIFGGILWTIGLSFRPQALLLLPCLYLARMGIGSENRITFRSICSVMIETTIGCFIGFVVVNVPLWFMGGFPAYYLDTFLFMQHGGHDGNASLSRAMINFISLSLSQNDISYLILLPLLLIICSNRSENRSRILIWTIACLWLMFAGILWTAVNPSIAAYHLWPMYVAESIALMLIAASFPYMFTGGDQSARAFAIAMCFSLAFWCDPDIRITRSVTRALQQSEMRDFTPFAESVDSEYAFPPPEWDLDPKALRELYAYLGSNVDSDKVPFEKIDTDPLTLHYHSFYLLNAGVVGDGHSWDSLTTSTYITGSPEFFRKSFPTYVRSLESVEDGFVFWIPKQAERTDFRVRDFDITQEVRRLFDIVRTHYEPVAQFGGVEIRRKKPALKQDTP